MLGLWGCWTYCSLSGGSLLLHPSSLPLKDNVVFPLCLDVAVGQVGGHKRKYAAMIQSSSRAGVKVSMTSLLHGSLFLSLGNWCFRSRFSRDGPHGAHLGPTGKNNIIGKRQFEVQRRSSVYRYRGKSSPTSTGTGILASWDRKFEITPEQCAARTVDPASPSACSGSYR